MSLQQEQILIQGKSGLWQLVIGIEVHAQVKSKAKLFSRSATSFGAMPNSQVSFIDAGFPGMLPTINKFCVEQAIKTGLSINGTINLRSQFDRKNYFYPDLPQGYQISQFYKPIVENGNLTIDIDDNNIKTIRINRIHLEQDAGKSVHDQGNDTLIDLNRSGVALMEIVSEPDINSIKEAQLYVKKLRALLRSIDTCDGNMEQGSLRADINISLRKPGGPLGTRTEIKNVNSIRFIGQAIAYEIQRQMELLEKGQSVLQETRLFDPSVGMTKSMRSKEDSHDYRYFPDPDLPPLIVQKETIENIRQTLPELPDAKKERYINEFGLIASDSNVLIYDIDLCNYFEQSVQEIEKLIIKPNKEDIKILYNWIVVELFSLLNKNELAIQNSNISPKQISELVYLILNNIISGKIAKNIFATMWETGKNPKQIVAEEGLEQISDTQEITKIITEVINKNPDKVLQYRAGKEKLFGFFIGQIMKITNGKANPKSVNSILQEKLENK